jgi:DNA-binding MarR family transcriptional regulator
MVVVMTTNTDARSDVRDRGAAGLEAALGFRLARAQREVRQAWEARIADLGVTSSQAGALRVVAERPGIGLRELARRRATDPMNAKRLADGLEAAGLVASGDDPADQRRRTLTASAAGLAVAEELERRAQAWSTVLEGIIGTADAARLRAILERLEAGIAGLGSTDERDRDG